MSVMIFDLKQCSIAANCTKMFAEIFTHAPTWTSSKHLSVWQYGSTFLLTTACITKSVSEQGRFGGLSAVVSSFVSAYWKPLTIYLGMVS